MLSQPSAGDGQGVRPDQDGQLRGPFLLAQVVPALQGSLHRAARAGLRDLHGESEREREETWERETVVVGRRSDRNMNHVPGMYIPGSL